MFLGGLWGVLHTYILSKEQGWGWYSGQNETPFGQNEVHLGKSGQKCSRIGGEGGLNHLSSEFWVYRGCCRREDKEYLEYLAFGWVDATSKRLYIFPAIQQSLLKHEMASFLIFD